MDNDDRGGVSSLLALGHRRIVLLNDTLATPFGREVLAGYLQAAEQHGLAIEPWLLRTSDWSITGGGSLRAVLAYECDTRSAPRARATYDMANVASARVMEKAGMRHEKTVYDADFEGNWAHRHHYAITKAEYEALSDC